MEEMDEAAHDTLLIVEWSGVECSLMEVKPRRRSDG